MPEEQTASQPQVNQPEPPKHLNIEPPAQGSKKWLWVLLAVIVLILIGVGIWLATKKTATQSSKETAKQATTSAKSNEKETKTERTKFAYTDKGNIWVLDVITKRKTQVTKDGSDEIYNSQPVFFDEDGFTHLKCQSSKCELWRVDFSGDTFTTEQVKKFSTGIRDYDVDQGLKTLVYLAQEGTSADQGSEVNRLHLFKFDNQKDKVIYETEVVARGGGSDDAIGAKISPNSSKILFVNTAKQTNQEVIVILDSAGNKLATLSGKVTEPVWEEDSKTFIYRDIEKGVFSYTIETKKSEEVSSETDWSGLALSPDGKKLAHNKGFGSNEDVLKDSSVYIFDLPTKTEKLVGNSLVYPRWVNNEFLALEKIAKCLPGDEQKTSHCLVPDGHRLVEAFLIYHQSSGTNYEVATESIPVF